MLDIYPREQLAKAMSIWVTGVTIGPIMGPALGGWLTDNYNWRWVFYINVPFGIVAFLGILSTLPEIDDQAVAIRFLRLCDLEPRGRRAADHPRSRAAARIGSTRRRFASRRRFPWRPSTSSSCTWSRRARRASWTRHSSRTGISWPGCLFIFNVGLLLYCDARIAAAAAARSDELSGGHDRSGHRAARPGYLARDAHHRALLESHGCALDHRFRVRAVRLLGLANDAIQSADGHVHGRCGRASRKAAAPGSCSCRSRAWHSRR